MKDNNDYETCRLLATYSNNSEILNASQLSLNEILNLISDARITFPYRLHGLILSFLTGIKYEFYPYHWKLQRVHDTIQGLTVEEIREKQRASLDEIKQDMKRMLTNPKSGMKRLVQIMEEAQ